MKALAPEEKKQQMTETLSYRQMGTAARDQAHTLFAQTMGYVALTAALFTAGAWLGRDLTGGVGIVAFIAGFAVLIGMQFAVRRSARLLAAVRLRASWPCARDRLFIAARSAGYATRRDLTAVARVCFWALLALIVAGIVLIFVHIPGGDLVYSILGLVIFAGFTMFDFQRVRRNTDVAAAPLLAASIFLDILNVFLFFLQIFSGGER